MCRETMRPVAPSTVCEAPGDRCAPGVGERWADSGVAAWVMRVFARWPGPEKAGVFQPKSQAGEE